MADGRWQMGDGQKGMDQLLRAARLLSSEEHFLSTHLRMGRPVQGPNKKYLRFEHRSHVIFYRQQGADIFIVRILHKRMDAPKNLPDA